MPAKRKDERANAMYRCYLDGLSLAQVAREFSTTRQNVFKIFRRRAFALRNRPEPKPFVEFDSKKYTLRVTGYYQSTADARTLLHRDVWEAVNGQIPFQHDIHHLDGDKTNNVLENLELISKSEHAKRYKHGQNQHTVARRHL